MINKFNIFRKYIKSGKTQAIVLFFNLFGIKQRKY